MRLTPLLLLAPLLAAATPLEGPCATGQLVHARAHWDELAPQQRHELMLNLPPYRAWLAAGNPGFETTDLFSEQEERETCIALDDLEYNQFGLDLGPYNQVRESEHFALQFNTDVSFLGDVISMLDALEAAWDRQITVAGFRAPPGADYQIPVYVEDLGEGIGGLTFPWPCAGESMPVIVLNTSWLGRAERRALLAQHELFHAVQFGYWLEELTSADSPNHWLLESTAAFANSSFAPETHDWNAANYAVFRALEPWRSIYEMEPSIERYGAYLFWQAVDAELDEGWLLEFVAAQDGQTGWRWDDALDALPGIDTDGALRSLARRLPVMDFGVDALHAWAPSELEYQGIEAERIGGMSGQHEPGYLPMERTMNQVGTAPRHAGTALVSFSSTELSEGEGLWLQLHGDPAVRWSFELVATAGSETVSTFSPEVVEGEAAAFFGTFQDVDRVFVAATPLDDFGGGEAEWSYEAELLPSEELTGFADEAPGSGCATGCSASPGGLLLFPLLVARRRRCS